MFNTIRTWFNSLHVNTQLMIVITGLNVIDFQTTKILVDRYGFMVEANPLMYKAMVITGSVWGLLVIKVPVLCFMWAVYDQVEHHHKVITPTRMTRLLSLLTAGFFALVTWNYSVIASVLTFPTW